MGPPVKKQTQIQVNPLLLSSSSLQYLFSLSHSTRFFFSLLLASLSHASSLFHVRVPFLSVFTFSHSPSLSLSPLLSSFALSLSSCLPLVRSKMVQELLQSNDTEVKRSKGMMRYRGRVILSLFSFVVFLLYFSPSFSLSFIILTTTRVEKKRA